MTLLKWTSSAAAALLLSACASGPGERPGERSIIDMDVHELISKSARAQAYSNQECPEGAMAFCIVRDGSRFNRDESCSCEAQDDVQHALSFLGHR